MPSILSRLRGLRAPIALDEPLRKADGGGGGGAASPLTTKGDLWGYDTADDRIPVGSNGQVLTADSTAPLGVSYTAKAPLTTKGDIYTATASALARLGVGANGNVLAADSTQPTGLAWVAPGTPTLPLTTKGDLLGFDTVADRIPIGADGQVLTADSTQPLGLKWAAGGGGGGGGVPSSIPDLTFWWESDNILGSSGSPITRLQERTPWITGVAAFNASGTVTIDATPLNSLPVLTWPAATGGGTYALPAGMILTGACTIFVIAKGATSSGNQALLGCLSNGGVSLYLGVGTAALALVETGIAIIGTSSAAWTVGTWFQANVTYNASTGAFAFRQAQAAANSGTGATGAGAAVPTAQLGDDLSSAKLNSTSLAAVIVYNRVLSPTEITTVEGYLHAKWAV